MHPANFFEPSYPCLSMTDNGWNKKVKKGFTACVGRHGNCTGSCPTKVVVNSYKKGGTIATCRVCSAKFPNPGGKDSSKVVGSDSYKTPSQQFEELRKQMAEMVKLVAARPLGGTPPSPPTPAEVVQVKTLDDPAEKEIEAKCKEARARLQWWDTMALEERGNMQDYPGELAKRKATLQDLESQKRGCKPLDQKLKQCKGRLTNLEQKKEKELSAIRATETFLHELNAKLLEQQAKAKLTCEDIEKAEQEIIELDKKIESCPSPGVSQADGPPEQTVSLGGSPAKELADFYELIKQQFTDRVVPTGYLESLSAELVAKKDAGSSNPAHGFEDCAAEDEQAALGMEMELDNFLADEKVSSEGKANFKRKVMPLFAKACGSTAKVKKTTTKA